MRVCLGIAMVQSHDEAKRVKLEKAKELLAEANEIIMEVLE